MMVETYKDQAHKSFEANNGQAQRNLVETKTNETRIWLRFAKKKGTQMAETNEMKHKENRFEMYKNQSIQIVKTCTK